VVDKLDDGVREIRSRGVAFLPLAVVRMISDIGKGVSIAEVSCVITPLLHITQSTSYSGGIDWFQAKVDKLDDRVREVQSRGVAFLPLEVVKTILDIGKGVSIAEVACVITPPT